MCQQWWVGWGWYWHHFDMILGRWHLACCLSTFRNCDRTWAIWNDLNANKMQMCSHVLCALALQRPYCGGSKVRYVRHGHLFFRSEGRTSFLTSPLYIPFIHMKQVITYNNNTPPPVPSIERSTCHLPIMIDPHLWYLKGARETTR